MIARRTVLLALFAWLAGCATTDSLEPGSGTAFEVKGRSYDHSWNAAVAMAARQLTIVEQNRDAGAIKAKSRFGLTTWGEVVGILIKPPRAGAKVYTEEVQSHERAKVQLTGQDWTQTIVAGIRAELGR